MVSEIKISSKTAEEAIKGIKDYSKQAGPLAFTLAVFVSVLIWLLYVVAIKPNIESSKQRNEERSILIKSLQKSAEQGIEDRKLGLEIQRQSVDAQQSTAKSYEKLSLAVTAMQSSSAELLNEIKLNETNEKERHNALMEHLGPFRNVPAEHKQGQEDHQKILENQKELLKK